MKISKTSPVVAAMIGGFFVGATVVSGDGTARADIFGGLLKGGAAVLLVHQFAGQLNSAINTLTANKNVSGFQKTKVVPIVSLGQGTYAGAAQVSGTQDQIDQVKSVGVIESEFAGHQFRLRALVPLNTDNPSKGSIQRVEGVGVSAIIDIKL